MDDRTSTTSFCDGGDGSRPRPVCLASTAYELMARGDPRRHIVLRGPRAVPGFTHLAAERVHLIGEMGAVIDASLPGSAAAGIQVSGGRVVIRNVQILGSTAIAPGIAVGGAARADLERVVVGPGNGLGIDAAPSAVLVVRRSWVRANLGGGVAGPTGMELSDSYVLENGSAGTGGSRIGGVAAREGSRLMFVTIAGNLAADGRPSGLDCVQSQVDASIIVGERAPVLAGDCVFTSSALSELPSAPGSGGNFTDPPGFIAPERGDYHLRPDALCRDRLSIPRLALPSPPFDWDGDRRPRGPAYDCGADEVP